MCSGIGGGDKGADLDLIFFREFIPSLSTGAVYIHSKALFLCDTAMIVTELVPKSKDVLYDFLAHAQL